mgnify:FL=1
MGGQPAELWVARPASPARLERARSFRILDPVRHVIRVHDVDFAAFLLCLWAGRITLIDAVELDQNERQFDFWDPQGAADEMALAYVNSSEARVLDALRRLKKVIYGRPRAWDPWKHAGRR